MTTLSSDVIHAICAGQHADPFSVLGPHVVTLNGKQAVVIRAFLPGARAVSVLTDGNPVRPKQSNRLQTMAMSQLHGDGLFEALFPRRVSVFRYRLLVVDERDATQEIEDPYAFPALLSDFDLHLFGEGNHERLYEKLGAHVQEMDGVRGVHFAVWAPNAERVSVLGPFNRWDGRAHPMRRQHGVGVWEIFLPSVGEGTSYKYEVVRRDGKGKMDKSDPFGFSAELRPQTASIVCDLDRYEWQDAEWVRERARRAFMHAVEDGVVAGFRLGGEDRGRVLIQVESMGRGYRDAPYLERRLPAPLAAPSWGTIQPA